MRRIGLVATATSPLIALAVCWGEPARGAESGPGQSITGTVQKSSGDVREGALAPDFELPDQDGLTRRLSDFSGSWVILYFYPKDDTPGCTAEAKAFRDRFPEFEGAGIKVLGVSIDEIESHERFVKKYNLPFILLADSSKKAVKIYGVQGALSSLVNRSSFLIDPQGIVKKIYEKVNPSGHAAEVLADVAALKKVK